MSAAGLSRTTRGALLMAVLLGGAVLMALEILAFRIIDKTFGSALRETSVVIAVFLAAMSVGYWAGGRLGDRRPRVSTLVLVLLAAGLEALVVPELDAAISPRVFASPLPLSLHAAVVTISLFFLPTMALAAVSPIAVRLLAAGVERSGSVAGGVAALSTVGSILGSVSAAFVLIDWMASVHRTIRLLALVALGLAALLAAVRALDPAALDGRPASWLARRRFGVAVAALLVAGGALVWTVSRLGSASVTPPDNVGEAPRPTDPFRGEVVFEADSRFHHIVVVDRGRSRSLLFKHAEVQSRMSLDDPYAGASEYTDYFHIPMLLLDEPRSALFVGLGGGSAPKRFARDYPEVTVDVVELDPMVVEVAQRFFHFEPGPRLRVANLDGRAFLKRSAERWDVIGIDAYSTNAYGSTMPAHMATREFFAEVRERLTDDGYLVMNVAAPARTPISLAIARTIAEVFPRPMVFAGATGNTLVVGSRAGKLWTRDEVVARAAAGIASGRIRLTALETRARNLLTSSLAFGDALVLTDDYAPVDTLMRQSRTFGAATPK